MDETFYTMTPASTPAGESRTVVFAIAAGASGPLMADIEGAFAALRRDGVPDHAVIEVHPKIDHAVTGNAFAMKAKWGLAE